MKLTRTWLVSLASAALLAGCGAPAVPETDEPEAPAEEPAEEPEPPAEAPADEAEPAEEPEDDASAVELPEVDSGALAECLPGNWYPKLEEWESLNAAGLEADVTHLEGGFVIWIDADLRVTQETWDLAYDVDDDSGTTAVVENGTRQWQLGIEADGAHEVRQSWDATDYDVTIMRGGETETSGAAPYPEVFDATVFQCDGDELTAHNPYGQMTLGREH